MENISGFLLNETIPPNFEITIQELIKDWCIQLNPKIGLLVTLILSFYILMVIIPISKEGIFSFMPREYHFFIETGFKHLYSLFETFSLISCLALLYIANLQGLISTPQKIWLTILAILSGLIILYRIFQKWRHDRS